MTSQKKAPPRRAAAPRSKGTKKKLKLSLPSPVSPRPKQLPFYAPEFTWETFEGFFCDYLAAHPQLTASDGQVVQVAAANLYGRRGDSQHGIDIQATIANGEVWAFQCKHYKSWGQQKTKEAISDCVYKADRKFLLVTRSVGPEVRDEIRKHADWEVWDADDISREFLKLPKDEAARLLYSNFGPGWPEQMLGVPGLSPLISAEAKFAPLLDGKRAFHHLLPLIGRRPWLKTLDDFLDNSSARVLLLRGRGGLGKSRLLLEWSRRFSQFHKGWALKFVVESATNIGTALDAATGPTVLILDDAHRPDELRRKLFGALADRPNIKIVLGLRPGPTAQIMLELTDAGLDLRQIQKPDELKRLNAHHALQLAEAALGDGLAVRHRLALRALSRNCPLLAVVAAELLKSGELSAKNLADTDECRTLVFDGMLREARPVREQFGAPRTDDFLHLLALLAPVQADTNFFKTAAAFLGDSTQPNRVASLVEALDDVGLLLRNGKSVSVTPDLLSDHLAYTACYDRSGQNTTFAERVNEHFSSEKFPRLLQHLSEAEWRARQQHPSADSIVEPIWRGFMERFEASSFDSRRRQIEQWTNLAHLQPQRTLSLAQAALDLEEAPAETNVWVFKGRGDSHAHVVEALPALLKPVAERHPDRVAPCLDLLWVLGKNQSAPRLSNVGNHPIAMIGKIAAYQKWKSRRIQEAALTWIEKLLQRQDWIAAPAGPDWILRELLYPFFGLEVEENKGEARLTYVRLTAGSMATMETPERAEAWAEQLSDPQDRQVALEGIAARLPTAVTGIGARLATENGVDVVKGLVEGSSSQRSGQLQPGDRIIGAQTDGIYTDASSVDLDGLVEVIRGEAGSPVRLWVMSAQPGGFGPSREVDLTREKMSVGPP